MSMESLNEADKLTKSLLLGSTDSLNRESVFSRRDSVARKVSSVRASIFNLSNTILGSGCLSMSHACLDAGLIAFTLLLGLTAYLSHMAMVYLFKAVEVVDMETTEELNYLVMGQILYGRRGELIASWAVTLQQFGACIAYVVIVGDVLQPVLGLLGWDAVFCNRAVIQIVVYAFIVFPLCLLPNMDSLKYISGASLTFIAALGLSIISIGIYTLSEPSHRDEAPDTYYSCGKNIAKGFVAPKGIVQWGPHGTDIFSALPVLCFAFLCHQNAFPIFEELPDASLKKMKTISSRSLTICLIAYFLFGLFGYLTFLDTTHGDLLTNFFVHGTCVSMVMNVVRVGFGFSLVLSYPLVVWEARSNLQIMVFGRQEYSFRRNFLMNLVIVSITVCVGVLAPGVESVLGLVGSTCSPLMMFVLPAAFYMRAVPGAWHSEEKRGAAALMAYGLTLIPVCTTVWFVNTLS